MDIQTEASGRESKYGMPGRVKFIGGQYDSILNELKETVASSDR